MKHFFFLLFFLGGALASFAQMNGRGAITVISPQPVMIAIDNRLYEAAGTELTIGNIPRGTHELKIYQVRNRHGSMRPGYLLFRTYVRLRPDQHLLAQYSARYGTLRIRKQSDGGEFRGNERVRPEVDTEGYNSAEDDVYSGLLEAPQPAQAAGAAQEPSYALTSAQLRDLRVAIGKLPYDTDKKQRLESVLGMKTYTVAQLREMAGWLEFEADRLDFLKWAYTNTSDKEQYGQLDALFRYESSKQELRAYVQQQH